MAENKYSEGWNRGFHEGYLEGVHDGHEKLLKEINKELLKLTLTSEEKQVIHNRGFQEGWQARQKEIDKLRKELESAQLEISLLRDTLHSYEEKEPNTENLMWEVTIGEAENAAYNKGFKAACKDALMEMEDNENLYEVDGGDMWHNLKNYLSMIIIGSEEE